LKEEGGWRVEEIEKSNSVTAAHLDECLFHDAQTVKSTYLRLLGECPRFREELQRLDARREEWM
jgi:hypothetical protein